MKKLEIVDEIKDSLRKHQIFLTKFHQFPSKTRKSIYVQLLQLPLNYDNFAQLTKPYPLLIEHTLDNQVSFIVGAITRLYPQLNNQWLPGIVYPFVRLFRQDSIASFESSLSFLANWYKPIFNNYPNPSRDLMKWFGKHLSKLQNKVNDLEYPLSSIIQPTIIVNLTDILNKTQWLQIYDFLIAHPYCPYYWACILLQILKSLQDNLIILQSVQKIALTLKKQKNLDINNLIARAKKLAQTQKQQLELLYSESIFPLASGRYPIIRFLKPLSQTNQLLHQTEDKQIQDLNNKLSQLALLVKKRMKDGLSADERDVNKRYEEIDGQMRQYLNKVRQQHSRKIAALKQIQTKYKQSIYEKGESQSYLGRQAIERRGRLEREIQNVRLEANSLRAMELDLLSRIQDSASIKKQQLLEINKKLKQTQRIL